MVTAPILPVVSVEEYLNNSYTPDMEYVDAFSLSVVCQRFPTPSYR